MPSVMPTVAVASAPRWATKYVSTMANRASMAISRTMGTARRKMARSREMAVKSFFEPTTASLNRSNHRSGFWPDDEISVGSVGAETGALKAVSPFKKGWRWTKSEESCDFVRATRGLYGETHRSRLLKDQS